MKVLITGASGFLGEYVVAEALRCGHQVRAMVRSRATLDHKRSRLAWGQNSALRVNRADEMAVDGEGGCKGDNSEFANIDIANVDSLGVDGLGVDSLSADSSSADIAAVDIATVDLRTGDGLAEALQDIDAVIHLAAAKSGDYSTQFADTVTATQTLLREMEKAGVNRLIAISSFSVYDYLHQPDGALLEEQAPLERRPASRDVYTQAKLQQEHLVRQYQTRCGAAVTVLRPGIIYGAGALWPCHLGVTLGDKVCVQVGGMARLPLTYVENCAEAIVNALISEQAIGRIVNVVDDDRPTQQDFIQCLRKLQAEMIAPQTRMPVTVTVPWKLMRYLARGAWMCDRLLGERLPLPGILIPARLHARFKPLDYSNHWAKAVLNWTPRYPLREAMSRSLLDLSRHQFPKRQPPFDSPQSLSAPPESATTPGRPIPKSVSMRTT
ncbi:MAG: NAD-dependent epimerase/dehydratase family protein [Synechococcus sp.]